MEIAIPQTRLNSAGTAPSTAEADRQLVDKIVYLASLASEREAVDPMLDSLRIITSNMGPDSSLSAQDKSTLLNLESKLKQYLVHDDPLRAFTRESLETRLKEKQSGARHISSSHFWWALGISLTMGLLPVLIPPYSQLASRALIFSPVLFFFALTTATTWFYLTSLTNFKPELRKAFILLCIGIIIFGAFFAQFPIILAFDLDKYPLFRYGGILGIVTLAWIFMYLGLRAYARLLGAKNLFTSLWVWLGLVLVAGAVAIALPHTSKVTEERFFELSLSGLTILHVTQLCGILVTHSIMRTATAAYTKSVFWLYIFQILCYVTNPPAIILMIVLGPLTGVTLSMSILGCALAPLLLFLYTGYSFKKETS